MPQLTINHALLLCLAILFALAVAALVWGFLSHRGTGDSFGGLAALGLLVGFVVGLSESPLIATVVTAAFALAASIYKGYADQRQAASVDGSTPPSEILRSGKWPAPLAVGALIGVLLGISVRVNSSLDFRDHGVKARLTAMGFDDTQVKEIMARFANEVTFANASKGLDDKEESALHAELGKAVQTPFRAPVAVTPFEWSDKWQRLDRGHLTPEQIVANLIDQAPREIVRIINGMKAAGKTDTEIIGTLRPITEKLP